MNRKYLSTLSDVELTDLVEFLLPVLWADFNILSNMQNNYLKLKNHMSPDKIINYNNFFKKSRVRSGFLQFQTELLHRIK